MKIKKLKGRNKIDLVFKKGKTIKSGSLKLHYINKNVNFKNLELGVGVSKRFVVLATRRNHIKRQINGVIKRQKLEVFKLLPNGLYMILYIGSLNDDSKSIWKDLKGLLEHFTS